MTKDLLDVFGTAQQSEQSEKADPSRIAQDDARNEQNAQLNLRRRIQVKQYHPEELVTKDLLDAFETAQQFDTLGNGSFTSFSVTVQ